MPQKSIKDGAQFKTKLMILVLGVIQYLILSLMTYIQGSGSKINKFALLSEKSRIIIVNNSKE